MWFPYTFEMWIVILKRRDYFEDIAINVQIEMHLERIVLGCFGCIRIALSRPKMGCSELTTEAKLSLKRVILCHTYAYMLLSTHIAVM